MAELKVFCKYCRIELRTASDINNGFHNTCQKEIEGYEANQSAILTKLVNFFPEHNIRLYIDTKFPLSKVKDFSYSSIESIQQNLSIYQTQFSQNSRFIILILFDSKIVSMHLNEIQDIPDFIFNNLNVRYISLQLGETFKSSNELTLDKSPNLVALQITSNSRNPFPTIRNLSGNSELKYLSLKHFGPEYVTTTPDGIESLEKLEFLILEFPLQEYPSSLCYLTKLHFLRIYSTTNNWTLIIPNTIINLRKLRGLQIESFVPESSSNEEIIKTPNAIELRNVTVENSLLDLDSFFVTGFALGYDELFPIINFRKLNQLFLNYCHIDEISDELLIFINLVTLDLSFNDIQNVPKIFRHARKLREIYITNNKLTEFEILCKIKHIAIIDVQNNIINSFPINIVKNRQKQFELIDIRGNQIKMKEDFPFVKKSE